MKEMNSSSLLTIMNSIDNNKKDNFIVDQNLVTDIEALRNRAQSFNFYSHNIVPMCNTMITVMNNHTACVALAGPQVGINFRIIVLHTSPTTCIINPVIVDYDSPIRSKEGDINFPFYQGRVNRYKRIKVVYFDQHQERHSNFMEGLTAKQFQHAMDYLDGVPFPDKLSKLQYNICYKKELNAKSRN